jgi:hypothetical protein
MAKKHDHRVHQEFPLEMNSTAYAFETAAEPAIGPLKSLTTKV